MAVDMASNDGGTSRRQWVWLGVLMVLACVVLAVLTRTVWPVIIGVFVVSFIWGMLRPWAEAADEGWFWHGMDEIPEDPARRALALRRIRDQKLMRRLRYLGFLTLKSGDRVFVALGYVMGLGGLGWLVLQVVNRNWTPRVLGLLVLLGFMLLIFGIGWLLHPARSWRATGDERMREDRLLWHWTPRGLARTQRWGRWQFAGVFAVYSGLVLAAWLAPRVGIGVPSSMTDLANELIGLSVMGGFLAIGLLVMPLPARVRHQLLLLSHAVLWAPEDGVAKGEEMGGGGT